MRIEKVRLVDFRNYTEKEIQPAGTTVLVGANASGKTNLMEAIQLTVATTSFRSPRKWGEVVRRGADEGHVRISASGKSSSADIHLTVTQGGKRTYEIGGTKRSRLSDVVGLVPCIIFSPDDLWLIKGPAEGRRASIDDVGTQAWAAYGSARRDYARAVRQRNLLLKEGGRSEELAPWTEQVVSLGARLLHLRTRLLTRMKEEAEPLYEAVSDGEELDIRYADKQGLGQKSWLGGVGHAEGAEAIRRTLEARRAEERARKATLGGPHRDDVEMSVDGKSSRSFASQGQQRTVALVWKLAALRVLEETTRRKPVLLLDDVMSELDEARRRALMALVGEETQTFITTTNLGYFDQKEIACAEIVRLP